MDTPCLLVLNGRTFTILLSECNGGGPWVSRNATIDGEPCQLEDIDAHLAVELDIDENDSEVMEAEWDKILIPLLAAAKSAPTAVVPVQPSHDDLDGIRHSNRGAARRVAEYARWAMEQL